VKILNTQQGSAEWLQARTGMITASRIKDVMSVLKSGGETQTRYNYKWELVAERLTGFSATHFVTPDMERGTELEPIARAEHEMAAGILVDQVGMVYHPTIEMSAASPDGLIDSDGAAEYKCPRTTTHLKWVMQGGVPAEHQLQCLWVMACCERQWIDFVSFDPSLPDGLRLFIVRMQRDEERIRQIEAEVVKFNGEVDAAIAELKPRVKAKQPVDNSNAYDELMAMLDAQEMVP
jgi:putative phage-type endonuclease